MFVIWITSPDTDRSGVPGVNGVKDALLLVGFVAACQYSSEMQDISTQLWVLHSGGGICSECRTLKPQEKQANWHETFLRLKFWAYVVRLAQHKHRQEGISTFYQNGGGVLLIFIKNTNPHVTSACQPTVLLHAHWGRTWLILLHLHPARLDWSWHGKSDSV